MNITKHLDSDKQSWNGIPVEIVRVVLEGDDDLDSEVCPVAFVKRADTGDIVLCFPEELSEQLPVPPGYIPPAMRGEEAGSFSSQFPPADRVVVMTCRGSAIHLNGRWFKHHDSMGQSAPVAMKDPRITWWKPL